MTQLHRFEEADKSEYRSLASESWDAPELLNCAINIMLMPTHCSFQPRYTRETGRRTHSSHCIRVWSFFECRRTLFKNWGHLLGFSERLASPSVAEWTLLSAWVSNVKICFGAHIGVSFLGIVLCQKQVWMKNWGRRLASENSPLLRWSTDAVFDGSFHVSKCWQFTYLWWSPQSKRLLSHAKLKTITIRWALS